jgi:hypothetical protein
MICFKPKALLFHIPEVFSAYLILFSSDNIYLPLLGCGIYFISYLSYYYMLQIQILFSESMDFWNRLASHSLCGMFHGLITLCFCSSFVLVLEIVNIATLADMLLFLGMMLLTTGMGLFLLRLEVYIIHDIFFQKGK